MVVPNGEPERSDCVFFTSWEEYGTVFMDCKKGYMTEEEDCPDDCPHYVRGCPKCGGEMVEGERLEGNPMKVTNIWLCQSCGFSKNDRRMCGHEEKVR